MYPQNISPKSQKLKETSEVYPENNILWASGPLQEKYLH